MQLFDCSAVTIHNLAKAGIITKIGRARYLLAPSIRGYVVHLRARAAGRRGGDASIDAITEGALLKREQRRHYELKNAELTGRLLPLEEIQPAWERVFRSVWSAIMSIPGTARFQLPHLTAADAEILEEIVRDKLEAAAFEEKAPGIPPGRVN